MSGWAVGTMTKYIYFYSVEETRLTRLPPHQLTMRDAILPRINVIDLSILLLEADFGYRYALLYIYERVSLLVSD